MKIIIFELRTFYFNSYVCYLTRGFIASTRAFRLLTRGFEIVTPGFELVTREFELVTRGVELVTRVFELVTRLLLFHIIFHVAEQNILVTKLPTSF